MKKIKNIKEVAPIYAVESFGNNMVCFSDKDEALRYANALGEKAKALLGKEFVFAVAECTTSQFDKEVIVFQSVLERYLYCDEILMQFDNECSSIEKDIVYRCSFSKELLDGDGYVADLMKDAFCRHSEELATFDEEDKEDFAIEMQEKINF